MKRAAPIANIRSLCALRLPSEQLIPAILETLHGIIPSACNLFDWTMRAAISFATTSRDL